MTAIPTEKYSGAGAALVVDSKVTSRGQTTLPKPVCEALNIRPGQDRLSYQLLPGGKVILSRMEEEERDPVMDAFLTFLADDMAKHPQRLRMMDTDLMARSRSLVAGMEVNLEDEIVFDDDE